MKSSENLATSFLYRALYHHQKKNYISIYCFPLHAFFNDIKIQDDGRAYYIILKLSLHQRKRESPTNRHLTLRLSNNLMIAPI